MGELVPSTAKRSSLVALGISFIYPFFWWTFFYVGTLSEESLYTFSPTGMSLLLGVIGCSAALWAREKDARALFLENPVVVPAICAVSVVSTLVLFACRMTGVLLPLALAVMLALFDAVGMCCLLFAWGLLFAMGQVDRGSFPVAISGSLLLFFGYVLMFIGAPRWRCLLCMGILVSGLIWWRLMREERPPASDGRPAGAARVLDWLPILAAYLATSVVYWLVFTLDVAGLFPESAFGLMGASPISKGEPLLYALFFLFLVVVALALLGARPGSFQRMLAIFQGVLAALSAVASLAFMYCIPGHVDIAEGMNCLVRADVQIVLLLMLVVAAARTGRPRWMLLVSVIDALLMLGSTLLFSSQAVSRDAIAGNLQNVSFACGVAIVICMAVSLSRLPREAEEGRAEARFGEVCASLAREGGLSGRELEVLRLVARGYSAKGIADDLQIATSTAQTHISRIYGKLDVHSKQELIDLVTARLRDARG